MKDFIKKRLSSIIGYIQNNLRVKTESNSPIDFYFEEVSKESYEFFKKHIVECSNFNKDEDIRSFCIQKALSNSKNNFLFCEFGVFKGHSIKLFSKFLLDKNKIIYGFDSFAGLEEEWISSDYNPVGKFSLNQKKPKLPKNVKIVQGRVEDTIETFLKDNSGNKIIFSHMDMDNYNPTKYTLEKIKPFLTQGSIVLFDEFYGFQGWKNHEFKALTEVFDEKEYKYIAFGSRQACIEIL